MNTLKKTLRIPKDRELRIKLPESFEIDKNVVITVKEEEKNEFEEKINSIKEAVNDKLYMEDLKDVMDDFKYIDSENI